MLGHKQYTFEQEDILNVQDSLIQLMSQLEEERLIDISTSRTIKRMILEENQEVIEVLQGYLQHSYPVAQLAKELVGIVQQSQLQRPHSP